MKRNGFLTIGVALLLTLGVCERHAWAQKIYLLVAADTEDAEIGKADEMDMWNIWKAFSSHVPEDQLEPYTEDTRESSWTGPSVQKSSDMKAAILNAIARCPAKGNDTIVFYWSGHGAYDSRGHYLVMPNRRPLYREVVVAAIKRKSPRLAVVISDSCNDWLESSELRLATAMMEPPLRISPLFDSLFIRHRGLVNINASSEEEKAKCLDECGGLFTSALTSCDEMHDDSGEPTGRGIEIEVRPSNTRRRTVEVPLGYFWTHAQQRESWNDLVTHVNRTMRTRWQRFTNQTVRVWSLPERSTHQPPDRQFGIPSVLSLSSNDVILSINGEPIRNEAECRREVRASGKIMEFTVRDSRDGTVWRMQTRLRASSPRFGVYLDDARDAGALVTKVRFGSSATRNSVVERVARGNQFDGGNRQRPPVRPPNNNLPSVLSLSRGDVILSVNGRQIGGRSDCIREVNNSPQAMTFTVRDSRDGTIWRMQAQLPASGHRFGVYLKDNRGGGAYVTRVSSGSPATRNRVLARVTRGN